MKFRIHVKDAQSDWWEDYDKDIDSPEDEGKKFVKYYNDTLRPGELKREFIAAQVVEEGNAKFHRWVKLTSGMSAQFRGNVVDMMRCERCGITGKRYGLFPQITFDSKYRKKEFRQCDSSLAYQKNKSKP